MLLRYIENQKNYTMNSRCRQQADGGRLQQPKTSTYVDVYGKRGRPVTASFSATDTNASMSIYSFGKKPDRKELICLSPLPRPSPLLSLLRYYWYYLLCTTCCTGRDPNCTSTYVLFTNTHLEKIRIKLYPSPDLPMFLAALLPSPPAQRS